MCREHGCELVLLVDRQYRTTSSRVRHEDASAPEDRTVSLAGERPKQEGSLQWVKEELPLTHVLLSPGSALPYRVRKIAHTEI